ncbi:acyl-CoA dehydrogenase family protein [Streptomyces sp. M10(2022)]
MAFGITEPDAGSNSHRITTTARKDGDQWLLTGRKVFVSGVDIADATLIVGRTEDARSGTLKPCLFIVARDAPASGARRSTWNSRHRRSSSNSPWTTYACPPTPWWATRTRVCSSCSPGSTPNAS